jgi:hypothetical protein
MAAAMLCNQSREENKSTLFCESRVFFLNFFFLLLSFVFFPVFFRDTSVGLGFTGVRTRSFACIIKR